MPGLTAGLVDHGKIHVDINSMITLIYVHTNTSSNNGDISNINDTDVVDQVDGAGGAGHMDLINGGAQLEVGGRGHSRVRRPRRETMFCETIQQQLWEQLQQQQPETQMGAVRQGEGQPDEHLGSRHRLKGNRQGEEVDKSEDDDWYKDARY